MSYAYPIEERETYATAFGRCAVAFIFTLLDFRIGTNGHSIDLIPDVIGYVMLFSAAGVLAGLDGEARTVRMLAGVLGAWSAFAVLLELGGVSGSPGLAVFGIITAIIDIVMVALLCGVVIRLGEAARDDRLVTHARNRRLLYILVGPIATLLIFAWVNSDTGAGGAGGLVIVFLVLAITILVLMYKLMREAGTTTLRLSPPSPEG